MLNEDETSLQEVTVKGSRPMHKMTVEGLTTIWKEYYVEGINKRCLKYENQ